jgi:hypothetical protein
LAVILSFAKDLCVAVTHASMMAEMLRCAQHDECVGVLLAVILSFAKDLCVAVTHASMMAEMLRCAQHDECVGDARVDDGRDASLRSA